MRNLSRISRSRRRLSGKRSGTAAVEFALTFPLVLMFFLSNIFFIQLFVLRNTASNAAYAAARQGIIYGSTEAEVREKAERVLSTIRAQEVDFNYEDLGTQVRVTLKVPVSKNTWVSSVLVPKAIEIEESVTLAKQLN